MIKKILIISGILIVLCCFALSTNVLADYPEYTHTEYSSFIPTYTNFSSWPGTIYSDNLTKGSEYHTQYFPPGWPITFRFPDWSPPIIVSVAIDGIPIIDWTPNQDWFTIPDELFILDWLIRDELIPRTESTIYPILDWEGTFNYFQP